MGAARTQLAGGDRLVVTRLVYGPADAAPPHVHSQEQVGYVQSGRFRLVLDAGASEHGPGDAYVVPAGALHAFEVIEPGEVVVVAFAGQSTSAA